MLIFGFLATAMLAFALALVLMPLLRTGAVRSNHARQIRKQVRALDQALASNVINATEYAAKRAELGTRLLADLTESTATPRPRGSFITALVIALLLPAVAISLYQWVGTPRALDNNQALARNSDEHGPDMQQAIRKLAEKLKQNPNDGEGWTLLGRAYKAGEQYAPAREALKRALELLPDNPDVMLEYAETLALSSTDRRLTGEARELIERALALDSNNQRGLWLLGISEYQAGQYDAAIRNWNRLLPLLPKDSDVARSVTEQIAAAQKRLGVDTTAVAETSLTATHTDAGDKDAKASLQIRVHIAVDPALQDKLAPSDVLFVFAKAANGPPMPLAIQRLRADQLPTTVTLDDSMGMLPNIKLSQFPQIILGARVSKSGNAVAQSGDLQTQSAALDVHQKETIELLINQIVP